ncbi:glycosyltransferase [Candidatus Fermentibacterales bacterium]|nr:glycosyltransferase [Candidatus Fermentibacterales bacterium]
MSARKLLFVAYFFPPVSTGSAPRNIRLARYLREAGWEMVPLTVENPHVIPVDPTLLDLLPDGMKVHTVRHVDPLSWLEALWRFIGGGGAATAAPPGERSGERQSQNAVKRFLHNYVFVPDRAVTWVPSALGRARRLIASEKIELVVSAGPPHSSHLLGHLAGRTTGRPWVTYYGDLWTHDSYVGWHHRSRLNLLLQRRIEAFITRRCNGIVTTTETSSEFFRSTYGAACPPVFTVMNGYDPDMPWMGEGAEAVVSRPKRREIRVAYAGFFMGTQTPRPFLEGLALFGSKHPDARVRFRVVGDFSEKYAAMPSALGLSDIVEVTGRVPYQDALAEMRDADLLLACLPPLPGSEVKNPTKLAEYLQAGGSILAVAPDGELTGIVDRLSAGYCASPSGDSVLHALERAWADWTGPGLRRASREAAEQLFDMRRNCARLAGFFDGVVRSASGS